MKKENKNKSFTLPAEWHPQSAIQLTWPHYGTDWNYMLEEITACYINLARIILQYQKLIIVCRDDAAVKLMLNVDENLLKNLILV